MWTQTAKRSYGYPVAGAMITAVARRRSGNVKLPKSAYDDLRLPMGTNCLKVDSKEKS